MLRTDGTTNLSFQIGGATGPIWITGVVWAPTSESTYNPLYALNAYDPTGTVLVPVRVGDAQQATDAVNLETVQQMFASVGLFPPSPDPSRWSAAGPGMFEGGSDASSAYDGATIYG
jgi:hypothetical protein